MEHQSDPAVKALKESEDSNPQPLLKGQGLVAVSFGYTSIIGFGARHI